MKKKKTFNTVLGEARLADSGYILPHEHLIVMPQCLPRDSRKKIKDYCIPIYNRLVGEFNCKTLVEVTPRMRPDPEYPGGKRGATRRDTTSLYEEICEATGINVVLCTGFYIDRTRPDYFYKATAASLAEEMIRDITAGIDNTGIKAGIIKIAISNLNDSDRKLLTAAAIAQKETGAAITTHTCSRDHRLGTLDFLEGAGVDPGRIYLGHADANSDIGESLLLAQRGCNLLFTIWGISNKGSIGWSHGPLAKHHSVYLCKALVDEGHIDQLLVSVDGAANFKNGEIDAYLYDIPERDSTYAFTFIKPELEFIGFSKEQIDQIMIENPRRMLSF